MAKTEISPVDQAWKSWVDCLKGTDTNSVFQQIYLMIWDTAIFRLVIESRQIQVEKNAQAPALNGAFHSFIDRNYFKSQVISIRRLVDKRYKLTGRKAVYSIHSLIDDLCDHRIELTREDFFRLKKKPYDYTEIQSKEKEFIRKQHVGSGFFIPPEFEWESIAEAHQTFDRLSGRTHKDRQPNDVIMERIFIRLKERLDTCQQITDYVDKFIAHSATPESRAIQNVDASEITFKKLWEAHRIIFEMAEFLSQILFSESHMALSIENPNFFQNWETPLFEQGEAARLRSAFESYRKETENWISSGIDDIWHWIES
jgi:hypothetical protein